MASDLWNRNGAPGGVRRRPRDSSEKEGPERSSIPKLERQAELCNWRRFGQGPAVSKGWCQCGCAGGGCERYTGGQKPGHDPRRSDGDAEKVRKGARTELPTRQSDAVSEKQRGGRRILS